MDKKQKTLQQMEMFDEISSQQLSPNQYYLMCSLWEGVTPVKINIHLELRYLIAEGWVTPENKLTEKSIELINTVESNFVVRKTKTANQVMGKGFKEQIDAYRELFPNMKLPSGKAARSAPGNLEKAFKWFFENYKYDWDLILRATRTYIDNQQRANWKFCRTSQYFIRKDNLSDLADMCDALQSGGYKDEKRLHNVKVV